MNGFYKYDNRRLYRKHNTKNTSKHKKLTRQLNDSSVYGEENSFSFIFYVDEQNSKQGNDKHTYFSVYLHKQQDTAGPFTHIRLIYCCELTC